MEIKLENLLENNRKKLDTLYRNEVLKLPEKIAHVVTLSSIDKLGLKPVHVSLKKIATKAFHSKENHIPPGNSTLQYSLQSCINHMTFISGKMQFQQCV